MNLAVKKHKRKVASWATTPAYRDERASRLKQMSTQHPQHNAPIRAIDRIFAISALTLAALSVVCFLAIIIGSAAGMTQADFGTGVWPVVAAIPLWGLPLAFVMIITLLITSFIRRGRAAKRG